MNDKEKQIMESFNKYQAGPEILKLYNRLDLALGEIHRGGNQRRLLQRIPHGTGTERIIAQGREIRPPALRT